MPTKQKQPEKSTRVVISLATWKRAQAYRASLGNPSKTMGDVFADAIEALMLKASKS